jgi:hypothetical protein
MKTKLKEIAITEDQVAAFKALGYRVERKLVAYLPCAEGAAAAEKKTRRSPLKGNALLQFVHIKKENLPEGKTLEFYLKLKELYRKKEVNVMTRIQVSNNMFHLCKDTLSANSIAPYINKMIRIDALKVYNKPTA